MIDVVQLVSSRSARASLLSGALASAASVVLACGGGDTPAPRAPRSEMPSVTNTTGGEAPRGSVDAASGPGTEAYPMYRPGTSSIPNAAKSSSSAGAHTSGGGSETVRAGGLSDDQIVQVAHVLHTAEVDQARLAREQGKDERVRRFATTMMNDHMDADGRGYELAKRRRLAPVESATSQALKDDSDRTLEQLQRAGASFDRVYMAEEVRAHRAALETLDNQLLPAAKNEEVKSMLQSVRAKVEVHMKVAQELHDTLGNGARRRGPGR
ncbi:DUF4142 domain-containing protein [Pendulispora albinea]|uniref:DUF4142 domain-containing protein n=1 Tax=Pendulispora albinea TaxID=2741071 RepID=A0ABZ2LSJ8_9BACT